AGIPGGCPAVEAGKVRLRVATCVGVQDVMEQAEAVAIESAPMRAGVPVEVIRVARRQRDLFAAVADGLIPVHLQAELPADGSRKVGELTADVPGSTGGFP